MPDTAPGVPLVGPRPYEPRQLVEMPEPLLAGHVAQSLGVDRGLKEGHFRGLGPGQSELPADRDLQPFP
jgi:hypothetical protein